MALKKTVNTDFGIEVVDAYHRVENVSLTTKDRIVFFVRSYASTAGSSFGEKMFGCAYSFDGANPMAQAYVHLKTLPQFADAVDC